MPLYFALETVENNKNKKSVKFQGHMLIFCDFIQVYVFSTNHHLKIFTICGHGGNLGHVKSGPNIKTFFLPLPGGCI